MSGRDAGREGAVSIDEIYIRLARIEEDIRKLEGILLGTRCCLCGSPLTEDDRQICQSCWLLEINEGEDFDAE